MLGKILNWFKGAHSSNYNSRYVSEAIELIDLVLHEIQVESFSKNYVRQVSQFKDSLTNSTGDNTLNIYLLGEQILIKQNIVRSKDKLNYRKQLFVRFDHIKNKRSFKIALMDQELQEMHLAAMFLTSILNKSISILGSMKENLLLSNKKLVEEYLKEKDNREKLLNLSGDIFDVLKGYLGNEATLKIYQDKYYELSEIFHLLEGFPFLINLVPEGNLNIDQLETLNKVQIQSLLMEKIDTLEYTNQQLSHEIKEKEKIENELIESENLLNKIIESAMDSMVLLDESGHIEYWSVQSEYLLGWDNSEIVGQLFTEKLIPSDLKEDFLFNLKDIGIHQEGSQDKRILETQLLHKEERSIDVEISLASVKLSKKWIVCAFIRDISQRKVYENEILQSRDKAEEASAAKLQFLSMMSHEIRTPLNAVIGTSQLLLEENPRKDQLENLNILKFSAENLLGIINDILDFNKVEEGKLILDSQSFNLDLLCENVVNSFIPQAKEKGIEIKYQNKLKRINLVLGDETRLSQVLINLFGNAVKFTSTGSVVLSVELINLNDRLGEVKFEIIDTGIGISPEKINSVFDRFTQVHQFDAKKKYGGTGLGLSISKNIVNLMGGKLFVSSKQGIGSNFYFSVKLPIPFKEDPSITEKEGDEFHIIFNKKILIVEDHKINQIVASKFLKKYKCVVEIAENGEIAVNKVKENENEYDLILMDLEMPVLDGYEAAIAIRNHEKDTEFYTPIVALSANALMDVSKKVQDAGMNGYISKPFDSQHFYAQIADNIKQ